MRFVVVKKQLMSITMLGCALLLSACAGTDRTPRVVKTNPVEFETSFEQISFKTLPAGKSVRLAINAEDALFQFKGGRSYYEALALPILDQPYILKVDSEVVKSPEHRAGAIFYPVLTFLDADKNWIKTFDALPYVTQKPLLATNYMTVSLQISDALAAARYVVIHTQDDKLNMAIGYYDGETLMQSNRFNSMMTSPGAAPRYRYEFAAEGWLRITARAGIQKGSS